MDDQTSEQINELAGLRDEHEKRLRQLLRQQALYGRSTAVEINIEIEEIQVKVGRITGDMAQLQIGSSRLLQQAVRAESSNTLSDISNQIGDSSTTMLHGIHTLIALMLQERDSDKPQRQRRQRITTVFYVLISILVLVDILIRLFVH